MGHEKSAQSWPAMLRRGAIYHTLIAAFLVTALGNTPQPAKAQNPGLLKRPVEILTPTDGVYFGTYSNSVAAKISLKWRAAIPGEARAGRKGKTIVQFRILKNGKTEKFLIAVSSGSDALDKAAMEAVRDASPLDPLPQAFKGRFIDVQMTFLYNLPLEYDKPTPEEGPKPTGGV
jgi:TonB family protein